MEDASVTRINPHYNPETGSTESGGSNKVYDQDEEPQDNSAALRTLTNPQIMQESDEHGKDFLAYLDNYAKTQHSGIEPTSQRMGREITEESPDDAAWKDIMIGSELKDFPPSKTQTAREIGREALKTLGDLAKIAEEARKVRFGLSENETSSQVVANVQQTGSPVSPAISWHEEM